MDAKPSVETSMDAMPVWTPSPSPLKRKFTFALDEYCFGSSVATGLEENGGDSANVSQEDILANLVEQYGADLLKERPSDFKRQKTPENAKGVVEEQVEQTVGTASFGTSVANLTKSLVGIGMLTLPRALVEGSPLVGAITLFVCGVLASGSFFMLGYCAHLTSSPTLPKLWEATIGKKTVLFVELVIIIDTLLSCVAFALLIGDYSTKSIGGLLPQAPPLFQSRFFLVLLVSIFILLPLCLAGGRRLGLLKFSSIAGLVCTMYVFIYVAVDCFLFRLAAEGGDAADAELAMTMRARARPAGILRSGAMFALAFMAHFNAPAFYADLKDHSPSRFAAVCATAFGAAFWIYLVFGLCGIARFGLNVPGNALQAYELSKPVLMMWVGMGLCVSASFPLVFAALRDSLLRVVKRASGVRISANGRADTAITSFLVVTTALAGAKLQDVSTVCALCGALSGAALAFIFPGAIMLNIKRHQTAAFVIAGRGLIIFGSILGVSSFLVVVYQDIWCA